MLSTAEK